MFFGFDLQGWITVIGGFLLGLITLLTGYDRVPLCPDLVVELASHSDEGARGISALRRKMAAYQANGAQLGWLLLQAEQAVEILRDGVGAPPQRIDQAQALDGGALFPGLQIDLSEVWQR